jgi:mRNA interferase RelE/StbE
MYNINYSNSAIKYLKKLSKKNQKHIISVIERAKIRPYHYFERIVGKKVYKLRAGDYRIIADIYNEELNILIIKIGHRKNIYQF